MKIKPECAICITRQVVDAAREITDDEREQLMLIKSCLNKIEEEYHEDAVPAWMGTAVHRYLKNISKNEDPYRKLKDSANKLALKYLDKIMEKVDIEDDLERLKMKVLVSIAGNVIDFGPYSTGIDIEEKIKSTLEGELKIDHSKELLEDLKKSKKVFYITDNAGEIVFDKPLIEEIKKYCDVVIAVKGKPILNDATLEDAKVAGLDKVAKVITSGTDVIGTRFEECSEEFLKEFESSDIVIAKGMGNYESLTEYEGKIKQPIYYIFKAKCRPIADSLKNLKYLKSSSLSSKDVDVDDNILLKGNVYL
ncbi:MAG: damage-control phosphatase, subfamily [Methanothermococcus sp.]|uniref:damage-control phosphatase ARMT1 family protein n=1 Tax=Methanothermococcus TaxID=155862 RepID=UPI0003636BD3|nr:MULTISPECIES: DUF89 domain-containing protein [Methanothermococcus]MDK2791099.1 damage-control phosphatase, subfamily [Methanothermococcus sp.]MDK2988369.1 damage-control phosphatase, subfamily [Methanothermococcus sp.]